MLLGSARIKYPITTLALRNMPIDRNGQDTHGKLKEMFLSFETYERVGGGSIRGPI